MTVKLQVIEFGIRVEEFARSVASLTIDLFLKKINHWSPRDILAHLIGWNRYLIKGCQQIKKGELPFYDINPGENYSRINAGLIKKYSSQDMKVLLNELQVSAEELKQYLHSLDEREWNYDYGVTHQGAIVTIKNTVDDLISDYLYHKEQIEDLFKKI
jgi:hypothetical protein